MTAAAPRATKDKSENDGHHADIVETEEQQRVCAESIVDRAASERADPHAERRDQEDRAVRGAHDLFAEVLARDQRVEGHDPAVRRAEDQREAHEGAEVAREEITEDHRGLYRETGDQRRLGDEAEGEQPATDTAGDRGPARGAELSPRR